MSPYQHRLMFKSWIKSRYHSFSIFYSVFQQACCFIYFPIIPCLFCFIIPSILLFYFFLLHASHSIIVDLFFLRSITEFFSFTSKQLPHIIFFCIFHLFSWDKICFILILIVVLIFPLSHFLYCPFFTPPIPRTIRQTAKNKNKDKKIYHLYIFYQFSFLSSSNKYVLWHLYMGIGSYSNQPIWNEQIISSTFEFWMSLKHFLYLLFNFPSIFLSHVTY